MKKEILKDFRRIPGVGPSIAEDLYQMGFRAVTDLKDADPEQLYDDFCRMQGCKVDRCMLYVFRCAVYEPIQLNLLMIFSHFSTSNQMVALGPYF